MSAAARNTHGAVSNGRIQSNGCRHRNYQCQKSDYSGFHLRFSRRRTRDNTRRRSAQRNPVGQCPTSINYHSRGAPAATQLRGRRGAAVNHDMMSMNFDLPVRIGDWKDQFMSDDNKVDERPGWVRLIVGARSTRRGSMTQMCALALLGCIGFAIFALENGRTSPLARIGSMI